MDRRRRLHQLAARQHGLVSRRQLSELGFTESAVDHAIRSGRLERVTLRVLRVCGSPDSPDQRAQAAALDVAGGAVAMHSAAALWGLSGYSLEPLHVLSGRTPRRGLQRVGTTHSSVRLPASDLTSLRGIPLTTPLRTLRDLAGRVHPDRLDQTCERMLGARLIRLEALHLLGAELPKRGGAPGTATLRRVIRSRPEGYRPTESNLELRFVSILERAGDAPFERQVDLGDQDGWIGRVDFLDRRCRVVVEVQSDLFHASRRDQRIDSERIQRLERAGWRVVEVFEREVWHRPDVVLAKVRAARAAIRRAA